MKMVYTSENAILVNNAKNLLQSHGIEVEVRNEFAASGLGELPAFDTWPELWLIRNEQEGRAREILATLERDDGAMPWLCRECGEENAPSFEICWNCQLARV